MISMSLACWVNINMNDWCKLSPKPKKSKGGGDSQENLKFLVKTLEIAKETVILWVSLCYFKWPCLVFSWVQPFGGLFLLFLCMLYLKRQKVFCFMFFFWLLDLKSSIYIFISWLTPFLEIVNSCIKFYST